MALAFHGVFASKHPTSNIPILQSYFVKSSESDFSTRNHGLLSRDRLFATRGVAAYFDEPWEARDRRLENGRNSSFDSFLSGVEFLGLASSSVVCVYVALRCWTLNGGAFGVLGGRIVGFQCVVLVFGLMAGALIRERQWRRICGAGVSRGGISLLERVEKLEQDLRSCTAIIHALSRQVEKLGIRFRVSRKTLRQPIDQTAALAQETSDATKALAAQDEILERELVEIQKVLLAMQEQQQKQLELILAIGKTRKLWGEANVKVEDERTVNSVSPVSSMDQSIEMKQTERVASPKEGNNKPSNL